MGKAPQVILDLVERFERNIASYRAAGYNEAQVRTEFIDPFFEALGWDMTNRAGYAEAYKDVIHEDAIKVGGVDQGPRLLLPHRRHAQVLRRSQEALGRHRRGRRPRLPAPPLRLVGQAAALDPDGLRGIRRLRLPRPAEPERQGLRRPASITGVTTSTPTNGTRSPTSSRKEAVLQRLVRQVRREQRAASAARPRWMPRS